MPKKQKILIVSIVGTILLVTIAVVVSHLVKQARIGDEVETIEDFKYFVFRSQEKFGVMDNKGNTIIDPQYESVVIPNPSRDVFICTNQGISQVMNEKNTPIYTDYEKVEPIKLKNVANDLQYEKSVLKYKQGNLYGLLELKTGKKITEPEYQEIENVMYKEGDLLIKQNDKYGVIKMSGTIIIEPQYDGIEGDNYYTQQENYSKSGYIIQNRTDEGIRYGYINSTGEVLISPECNDLFRINEITGDTNAYIIAAKNGQYGFFKNSEQIINCEYQEIQYEENNDLLILQKAQNYGVANRNGNFIIPVENSSLDIKGMNIYVKKDNQDIIYNQEGKIVNLNNNQVITKTGNELYRISVVTKNGKEYYGVMDNQNNSIIPEQYNYLEYVFGEYFIVEGKDDKYGVLNINGKEIIPIKYDLVQRIDNKNAIQTLDTVTKVREIYSEDLTQTGAIENSNIITTDSYIKVFSNEELKYFDNNGNEITPMQALPDKTLFSQSRDGKWGFVNKDNQEVIPFIYDMVTDLNEFGFAAIKKDGKWGSINEQGDVVQEPVYQFSLTLQEPQFIGKYYKTQLGFGENYYTDGT